MELNKLGDYITLIDLSKELGVTQQTLTKYFKKGIINKDDVVKLGNLKLVPKKYLEILKDKSRIDKRFKENENYKGYYNPHKKTKNNKKDNLN